MPVLPALSLSPARPAWLPGTGLGVSALALVLRPSRYTRRTTVWPAMYGRRTARTVNDRPLSVAACLPDPKRPRVVSESLPLAGGAGAVGAGVGVGVAGGGVWAAACAGSARRAS